MARRDSLVTPVTKPIDPADLAYQGRLAALVYHPVAPERKIVHQIVRCR